MKKTAKILTLFLVLCILAASSAFAQANVAQETAEATALNDAGITRENALLLKTETGIEHTQTVYEVEFECDGLEYEYWIDADTGAIVKRAWEPTAARAMELYANQSRDGATIDEAAARQGALSAAGLAESDVIFAAAWLDEEDGLRVYEVSFFTANGEYEYQIDAVSGAVYSASTELFPTGESVLPGDPTDDSSTGRESAKATALADAGLSASDVIFTKAKLDWEDGIQVYEIEFATASTEYEYEINAATGEVYSRSAEALGRQTSTPSAGSYIGVDQAKSIAVKHAGLSLSDVTFTKAKLENDDGQKQYEIEFRRNGVEYEYSIHATTGSILDCETDWNDGHDDDRCEFCGQSGHDDDHCPSRPAHHDDDDDDDYDDHDNDDDNDDDDDD